MASANNKERILIVDDSPSTLELLQRNLSSKGYQTFTAPGVAEAIRILDETPIDLVITDLKMPRVSGLDLIRHVRENFKDIEVMMITGYASVESAVEAVKTGAEEYLSKPFTDDELFSAVRKTLGKLHARRTAQSEPKLPKASQGLIGESKSMHKVLNAIAKAATTTATALITGESGTGKELVARAIHYSSSRASSAFVPVNCGAIPETLLESELFGNVKGAYTGATETREGFFQTAQGGTIFLDEISEMPFAMQVKLLRVLQDKVVTKVGSRKPQKVDVRVIAATNKDLSKLAKSAVFREDLFYRLNVITVEVPPLRERKDDILPLVNHFVKKYSADSDRTSLQFTASALDALRNYYWSGNVRELENAIQRLVVMSDEDIIDVHDLPTQMHFTAKVDSGLQRTLSQVEMEHIRNVLASVGGNKTRAAEILGIDRKTLREKLKYHTS